MQNWEKLENMPNYQHNVQNKSCQPEPGKNVNTKLKITGIGWARNLENTIPRVLLLLLLQNTE
jgi:hypothetical protein